MKMIARVNQELHIALALHNVRQGQLSRDEQPYWPFLKVQVMILHFY